MAALPYEYYVDIVTKRYFHGVDHYDMEMVLDCFHDDAVLTEVTSDRTRGPQCRYPHHV